MSHEFGVSITRENSSTTSKLFQKEKTEVTESAGVGEVRQTCAEHGSRRRMALGRGLRPVSLLCFLLSCSLSFRRLRCSGILGQAEKRNLPKTRQIYRPLPSARSVGLRRRVVVRRSASNDHFNIEFPADYSTLNSDCIGRQCGINSLVSVFLRFGTGGLARSWWRILVPK